MISAYAATLRRDSMMGRHHCVEETCLGSRQANLEVSLRRMRGLQLPPFSVSAAKHAICLQSC